MDFFGIGILELLVILVVALLALGPDKLPEIAQKAGRMLVQARRSIAEAGESFVTEIEAERQAPKTPAPAGGPAPVQAAAAGTAPAAPASTSPPATAPSTADPRPPGSSPA